MISEKDYNEIYLKGYEDGKNDNDNLKISYEIKPSFTTRKIKELQQENQKYKEVIDKINHYIEKQTRMYGLSMPIELGTHLDNILSILKEVSE